MEKKVNSLISRCKKIVGHFHSSNIALQNLKNIQIEMNPNCVPVGIPSYCATRWTSAYKMLSRLYRLKSEIVAVSKSDDVIYEIVPDEREGEVINGIAKFLQIFKEATELLEGDAYPTLPWLIDTIFILRTVLRNDEVFQDIFLKRNESGYNRSSTLSNFRKELEKSLKKRFVDGFCTCDIECGDVGHISLVAALLHPRTWNLQFFPEDLRKKAQKILKVPYNNQVPPNETADEKVTCSTQSGTLLESLRMQGTKYMKKKSEYHQYIELTVNTLDVDALAWWPRNSHIFPNIAKLARQYLSIPCSSSPTERIFSVSGQIDAFDRKLLSPSSLSMQSFLKFNGNQFKKLGWL